MGIANNFDEVIDNFKRGKKFQLMSDISSQNINTYKLFFKNNLLYRDSPNGKDEKYYFKKHIFEEDRLIISSDDNIFIIYYRNVVFV